MPLRVIWWLIPFSLFIAPSSRLNLDTPVDLGLFLNQADSRRNIASTLIQEKLFVAKRRRGRARRFAGGADCRACAGVSESVSE